MVFTVCVYSCLLVAAESQSTSAAPSTWTVPTSSSVDQPTGPSDASVLTTLFVVTVSCLLVAVAALVCMTLVFCKKFSVLCFRKTFRNALMLRYDIVYLTCSEKLTIQLNLPHPTNEKKLKKKTN